MEGWMIALIVVAGVIVFFSAALFIGSLIAVDKILGRHKPGKIPTQKDESGDLDSTSKYGIDIAWFGLDEIKSATRTLEITSYDGIKLRALLISHGENVGKVGILHHGFTATPRSMQAQARILYDKGYDVLLPAARAHDISDGKYSGMGWLDRFDSMRWIDKVIELYGERVRIAMVGVSMGGATVAGVSGMNPPPQVKCIIDDCGFSSQRDEYFGCIKVPLPKAMCLLPLVIGTRIRCGYSIYDADFIPLVKNSKTPTLFFHGEADSFVPAALGKKMFDACGAADKLIHTVPGAGHALSFATDRDEYTKIFTEFVDKHVGE